MTPTDSDPDMDDPLMSTQELIEDARRPMLIARHRELVEEMEGNLTDSLVTGSSDHPRLKRMLAELEAESEQARIIGTMQTIANEDDYEDCSLQEALIQQCCLLREERGIEVAALQLHIIGVYRKIRSLMSGQHGLIPDLEDLRTLEAPRLVRLLDPLPIEFGSPQIGDHLVVTRRQAMQELQALKRMSRAEGGDTTWADAEGPAPLPRELDEPLLDLDPAAREQARQRLIADRIRSQFYRNVFLGYFDRDTLSPEEISAHQTILHWLHGLSETPHMYPFMQGQTTGQKTFRLSRLLRKIVQLNEIYQRVAQASLSTTYRERFEGLNTRDRLQIMAKDRYPPIRVDDEFLVQTMVCPFEVFARWVQDKVANKDFVLPPDPKKG